MKCKLRIHFSFQIKPPRKHRHITNHVTNITRLPGRKFFFGIILCHDQIDESWWPVGSRNKIMTRFSCRNPTIGYYLELSTLKLMTTENN